MRKRGRFAHVRGDELDADAENEAIRRRRRRRRRRVSGRDEEGTGIEFGCVEDREIPWRERKAEEVPEELKRKREIGWSGEE